MLPHQLQQGFKVWEGSVDLVNYLVKEKVTLKGLRVIDLGCGHAFPGMHAAMEGAHVDLQDYNEEVISEVTMMNAIANLKGAVRVCVFSAVAWLSVQTLIGGVVVVVGVVMARVIVRVRVIVMGKVIVIAIVTVTVAVAVNSNDPKHASLTVNLVGRQAHQPRYFCGDWGSLAAVAGSKCYDVILTAETIYDTKATPRLVTCMHDLLKPGAVPISSY